MIDSPRDLACQLNERLKLGLTPRPWNLYAPGDTFWWLVPSTDWPAYRYGKLAFSLAKDAPRKDFLGLDDSVLEGNKIFAGFNVEKGYGEVATFVKPALKGKRSQIIDPSWLWFVLMDKTGCSQFADTLARASSRADLYIYVTVGYVHDRESEARVENDSVMFKCTPSGLVPLLRKLRVHVLDGAYRATSFTALADTLRGVDDYHWVDLYVGTHVSKGDVDLLDLYDRVFSYFEPWLK